MRSLSLNLGVTFVGVLCLSVRVWCFPSSGLSSDDSAPWRVETSTILTHSHQKEGKKVKSSFMKAIGPWWDSGSVEDDEVNTVSSTDDYRTSTLTSSVTLDTLSASTSDTRLGGREPKLMLISSNDKDMKYQCDNLAATEEICIALYFDDSIIQDFSVSVRLVSKSADITRALQDRAEISSTAGKVNLYYTGKVSGLSPGTSYRVTLTAVSSMWSVTSSNQEDYCTAPVPPKLLSQESGQTDVNVTLAGGAESPTYHVTACLVLSGEELLCSSTMTSTTDAILPDLWPGGHYKVSLHTEFCGMNSTTYTENIMTVPAIEDIVVDCHLSDCQTQVDVQWSLRDPSYADRFYLTYGQAHNLTIQFKENTNSFMQQVTKLSPASTYEFTVMAVVQNERTILTHSMYYDYTTYPAPAVINNFAILNAETVRLSLSTDPPMEDLKDGYYYMIQYCLDGKKSSACEKREHVDHQNGIHQVDLTGLQPFIGYNITVQSYVFDTQGGIKYSQKTAWIPLRIDPGLSVTANADQTMCPGLNPTSDACVHWSLSLNITSATNITILIKTSMGKNSETVVPPGGLDNKGDIYHMVAGLSHGLSYTFTVVVTTDKWFAQNSSQPYYTYPTPPEIVNQTTADVNSVTLNIRKTSDENSKEIYEVSVCDISEGHEDCEDHWTTENIVMLSPTLLKLIGMRPLTTYQVSLRSVIDKGENSSLISRDQSDAEVYTAPPKPSPPKLHDEMIGSLTVTWENSYVTEYKLLYGKEEEVVSQDRCQSECKIVLNKLQPGKIYSFTLYALNGPAVSAGAKVDHPMAPRNPYEARTASVTETSIQLQWGVKKTLVNNFFIQVYDGLNPDDWGNITVPVDQRTGNIYSSNITGLTAGHPYDFTVRSVITFGDDFILGPSATALNISNNTKPSGLSDFSFTEVTPTTLTLEYRNNSRVDSYSLDIVPMDHTIGIFMIPQPGNQQVINLIRLIPGTDYTLTVYAKSGVWKTEPYRVTIATNETAPGSPINFALTSLTATSLQVHWSAPVPPNGHILGYHVMLWEDDLYSHSWEVKQNITTEETQFTNNRLISGHCYSVSVAAINGAGIGTFSENITVSTLETAPSPPQNITSKKGSHTVEVRWLPPSQPNGIIRNYTVSTSNSVGKVEERTCLLCCDCPVKDVCHWDDAMDPQTDDCNSPKKQMKPASGEGCDTTLMFRSSDSSLSATVINLHAYAHYTIRVEACTAAGCGQRLVGVDTRQDAPTAPQNLQATAVSSTSVYLNWTLPADTNGVIQFYGVTYGVDNQPNNIQQLNTTSDVPSVTISKLQKWTKYSFYVRGFTTKFGNKSLSVSAMTLEDAPGTPPKNVHTQVLNASAVEVSWSPPQKPNGFIWLYYITLYNLVNDVSWKTRNYTIRGDGKSKILTGLSYWTHYKVDIRAGTKAGKGPRSTKLQFLTDEYAPTSAPQKFSSSPVNATCIKLTWSPPAKPNGKIIGYDISYIAAQGGKKMKVHVSGDKQEVWVGDLKYWTEYTFRLSASTSKGAGPEALSSQRTNQYVPTSPVTGIKALAKTSQSVFLSWNAPSTPNGVITGYKVFYSCKKHDVGDNSVLELTLMTHTNETVYNLTRLEAYWKYRITIQSFTVKGEGLVLSKEFAVQTGESVPGPPVSFRATPVNSTSIKLSWKQPDFPNGKIVDYHVFYESQVVGVEPEYSSVVIRNLKVWTVYEFCLSASTVIGEGLRINATARTKEAAPLRPDKSVNQPIIVASRNFPLSDPHTQAAIDLPMTFFMDNTRGDPVAWGIIVIEASITDYRNSSITYTSGKVRCSDCITWRDYHNNGVRKPYRATPDDWNPIKLNFTPSDGTRQVRSAESAFVLGEEKSCAVNTVYCNGYLKPGTKYRVKAFVCNLGGCTDTYYSNPVATEAIPADRSPGIAGAIVAVLLVLAIVGVLVFMKRINRGPFRKKSVSEHDIVIIEDVSDSSAEMEMVQKNRSIKQSDLATTIMKLKRSSNLGFAEEYKDLKDLSPKHPHTAADIEMNRSKNRYTNILPFDHSRVKLLPLDDEEGSDYINANYISGYISKREYIAAQGPLPGTKDDFWRMIWEQNVSIIVMLTKCMEGRGRVKCEQYWPKDDEPVYFGELIVQQRSESILSEYDIRILDIKLGESAKRTVKHFHFLKWPDFGCPTSTKSLVNFVWAVESHRPPIHRGPVLVHCRHELHVMSKATEYEPCCRACWSALPPYLSPCYASLPQGTDIRTIKLYQLKIWPDFGYPETAKSLLTLIKAVRREIPPSMEDPLLVHCREDMLFLVVSAGVGRTGTYIAVDCLLQQMRDHQEVDIFGRVLEMREHRTHMVQTEDQYIYIHDCCLEAYKTLQADGEENSGYKDEDEDERNIYQNLELGRSRV